MKDKSVILIVDDQPQNIELLETYLIPQGYKIVSAANGEEALEKLSANQIDLILLDVQMPGIDGFEVIRRIRQDNIHRLLPIILVTALRETEDRVKGIEAGCDDFISKPVNKIELLARIRSELKVAAYNDLMGNYQKELESEITRKTEELKHASEKLQRDMNGRKLAEEALRESEEKYRTLVENAVEVILIAQDGRLKFVNRMASKITGYSGQELRSSPFLEFIHPDDRKMVGERYLRRLKGDQSQPRYEFKLICKDGSIKWVEIDAVLVAWEGKPATLNFLSDITERKEAEKKLGETLNGLRRAIGGIIQVLSSTTEKRDPYTAGHQRRVADLARAIGQEIGLPAERVEGLRLAGTIHDIGKVTVPAEILSKPTPLTEIEYKLIQSHPKVGYDIVQDIEFSWPIAQMILQHHERLNGSGYPNGLKGEEILLEARILAVSDVVEAMASYRPYRPALGIEVALKEIEKNNGILYDPDVVSACLALFREKGFKLK